MPSDDYRRGYRDGWQDAGGGSSPRAVQGTPERPPKKRKVSAYHKRLGSILKSLKKKHTLKSGKWRKGWSQRRLMKAAHKEAKK